jgi:hypothetical protein
MTIATDPLYEKPRNENFDVVLIKRTASELMAKRDDFKRIPVQAENTIAAQWLPEVVKEEKEYRVLTAVPPGFETEPEAMARQREYAGNVTDRANIGLTGADHVPTMKPFADPNAKK